MYKILLSLFLITPILANDSNHVDLTTSKEKVIKVALGQKFIITAIQPNQDAPWKLKILTHFKLVHEGRNQGCIGVMASNTQIWSFLAMHVGKYEIELYKPKTSPVQQEKVSVEVYQKNNDGK